MDDLQKLDIGTIIDSLSDGVYVCDPYRKITYWSKSAERITGWHAGDIVGRHCFDGVLCHVDKDGHQLCGEEYCPLHRAMRTGTRSRNSLLVYARGKEGQRIPMQVSVAPIRNADGRVIGGVETFRDASALVHDLERAKTIQAFALQQDVSEDTRVTFQTHYIPHEIIGGDYYAIKRLDDNRYGLMLADVMGHGIAAALYTMHLRSLWDHYGGLLTQPAAFAGRLNNELVRLVQGDESFATALCGLLDLEERVFRFTGAGGPPVLLIHADGAYECLETSGLPLAVVEDTAYDEATIRLDEGDCLLIFSDGVTEIANAAGEMLGIDGLVGILSRYGYPKSGIQLHTVEEQLLKYSNAIRFDDDLTFMEIRFSGSP